MKDKKRRLETWSFHDYTGMETHLTEMAAKGWMIERISSLGWVYRRITPARIHFAVTYYPQASGFDPELTEGQRTFQDFCSCTGWQLACTSAQMQIYYNETDDPIPLETDPVVKTDTIHRAAKKAYLPAYFLLLAIAVFQCAMFLIGIRNDPIRILSSPSAPCTGATWILLLFLCAAEIGGYFRWYHRAVKAAEHGEFTDVKGHSWQLRMILGVLLPALLYWLVTVLAVGPAPVRRITIAVFSCMIALNVVIHMIREFLRRVKAPRNVNRTVTICSCFLLYALFMCAVLLAVIRSSDTARTASADETYEYNGITWAVRRDDLPLTVEDLMETEPDIYSREHTGNESLLLSHYEMRQNPRFDLDNFSELPALDYSITIVKLPALYGLCRDSLLQKHAPLYTWQACEASFWNAQEAYQLTGQYTEPMDWYLLCYPDRIVEIQFNWTPAPAQMEVVGQRLYK